MASTAAQASCAKHLRRSTPSELPEVPMKRDRALTESTVLDRFNCGPIAFAGGDNALYERHLTFDHVSPIGAATPRDKFEAIAHSIRDLLSQRWLKTEQTYNARNVKRVYYVSLEFLM